MASKKLSIINGIKFRIYKTGTGTFIFMKKTAKQKKIEDAKRALPSLPFDVGEARADRVVRGGFRGRGGFRDAGRGRGGGRGRPARS